MPDAGIAALAGLRQRCRPTGLRRGLSRCAPSLWFNEELNPDLSTLTVWGPRGVTTPAGTGGVDLSSPTRRSMVSEIKPLRAGVYTVRWRAASARDLAVTQGSFQFTVKL